MYGLKLVQGQFSLKEIKIGIIGLGYVGLPLALAFARIYPTVGFDTDKQRITELRDNQDRNNDATILAELEQTKASFTSLELDLAECNCYIITVPTPLFAGNLPDLTCLRQASQIIAKYLQVGDTVTYESTVYPGAIEEVCVPILEDISSLTLNKDFAVGYSPERISPSDDLHTLEKIIKVVSASNTKALDFLAQLYDSIIPAGVFRATSIKTAEAAKVIENIQRDLNIALINELSIIFSKIGIDTNEVLDAASTKWNFMRFNPGLVGGHCIGVDPYYLTYKAQELGHEPRIILAGRAINNGMASFVANKVFCLMQSKSIQLTNAKVLVLGFAFKANCSDYRNSKVADLARELANLGTKVDIYDPKVCPIRVNQEYGLKLIKEIVEQDYDALILAVEHKEFLAKDTTFWNSLLKEVRVVFDIKGVLPKEFVDERL